MSGLALSYALVTSGVVAFGVSGAAWAIASAIEVIDEWRQSAKRQALAP